MYIETEGERHGQNGRRVQRGRRSGFPAARGSGDDEGTAAGRFGPAYRKQRRMAFRGRCTEAGAF